MSDFAHHGPGSIAVPSFRQLDIENRPGRANCGGRRHFCRPVAHYADGFARQDGLTATNIGSLHPGQEDIISFARVDDQELAIASVGSRIEHGPVGRRRNHRARQRGDQNAMLRAAQPVGGAERLQDRARDGQRQAPLRFGEGGLGVQANRLDVARLFRLGLDFARGPLVGRPRGVLFGLAPRFLGVDPCDQILEARSLAREFGRPLLLRAERRLGLRQRRAGAPR